MRWKQQRGPKGSAGGVEHLWLERKEKQISFLSAAREAKIVKQQAQCESAEGNLGARET